MSESLRKLCVACNNVLDLYAANQGIVVLVTCLRLKVYLRARC